MSRAFPQATKRIRYPKAGVAVKPTKEKSMTKVLNPSACMSSAVRDCVTDACGIIAHALKDTMPMPVWNSTVMALHFVPDREDREAIMRTARLCPTHVPHTQFTEHVMELPTEMGDWYRLKFRFQTEDQSFLFPQEGDIAKEMRDSEEYQSLIEYGRHWVMVDERVTHLKMLAGYMAHACTSINQLRHLWGDFDAIFSKKEYGAQFQAAHGWVERFRTCKGGQSCDNMFPGFQAHVAQAQATIGMYLAMEKGEDVETNITVARSSPIQGPDVPWRRSMPDWLKGIAAKHYTWCL